MGKVRKKVRPDWDAYFLGIAHVVAKRSTCPRLAVGAVVTLNNKILTTGYNGAPPGDEHCSDVGCRIVYDHCVRVIHAESNALKQLANHPLSKEMKIYVTHKPCDLCINEIKSHNIKETIYDIYETTRS